MLTCKNVDENEDLKDINPKPVPPEWTFPTSRWTRSEPEGRRENKGTAWHRGKVAGQIEAILKLQELGHAEIAGLLQGYFGIGDNGSVPGDICRGLR